MIDIDHFKAINDRLGHAAGDAVLQVVAPAWSPAELRGVDVFGRFGGEEFLMVLPGTDAAGALASSPSACAPRTEAAAVSRLPAGGVTVTVGVAETCAGRGAGQRASRARRQAPCTTARRRRTAATA